MSEELHNGNGKTMPAYIAGRLNLDDIGSSRRVLCVLADDGPTTQQAAGQQLGLTAGTCNLHFQRLEHDGLIYRVRHQRGGRGRPTVIWDIDTEHNFCVSLVFDVPYLEASLTNFRGDVIHQHWEDLTGVEGQGHIREVIDQFMTTATERVAEAGGWMRQVFVAVPGLLDPETGAVEKAVNLPSLNGYDAREHIEGTYKVPCFAGSLGLACYYGETEQVPPDITTMVIYWDLGVGVVFGCQHQILSLDAPAEGSRRLLSELGHVRVVRGGRPCHCGNRGCVEAYTGGAAILEELARQDLRGLADLVQHALDDDRPVVDAAAEAARRLGRYLTWPIQVMGVDRIVVTGPMAPVFNKVRKSFLEGLAETFDEQEQAVFRVEASTDPRNHLLRGAYLVGRRLFFHPEDYQALMVRSPKSKS